MKEDKDKEIRYGPNSYLGFQSRDRGSDKCDDDEDKIGLESE